MLGAIAGDIIGSPYEFTVNNIKTTNFPLFSERSHFTDDTVMTVAVPEGIRLGYGNPEATREAVIDSMHKWGINISRPAMVRNLYRGFYAGAESPTAASVTDRLCVFPLSAGPMIPSMK